MDSARELKTAWSCSYRMGGMILRAIKFEVGGSGGGGSEAGFKDCEV